MKTFEECCEYLGIPTDLPKCYVREKQIQAAYKLSVCMMAWNRQDGFEPNEKSVYYQEKTGYTPHFRHKNGSLLSSGYANYGSLAGIVPAYAHTEAAYTYAHFGLRLSLKTRECAIEFGETFIEIFNELI